MSASRSRGRALLFEHLPFVKFRNSVQGVLFIIFSNGEGFFYPLNEQTKGNSHASAKLLTTEPTSGRKFRGTDNVATKNTTSTTPNNDSSKYFAYDVALNLNQDLHRVINFNFFLEDEDKSVFIPPRKVLLSHDKRFLLILGASYKKQSCLIIYQIQEDSMADFFRVIFYDLSSTFIDVCFTPNSSWLAAVTTKYPSLIFILQLPMSTSSGSSNGLKTFRKVNFPSNNQENPHFPHQKEEVKQINYEARRAGPLSIIGPGTGLYGQPTKISKIISTYTHVQGNNVETFELITWNDDGYGEYLIWRVTISQINNKQSTFETFPRYITPKPPDRRDLIEDEEASKNFILHMEYSDVAKKLLLVTKRENYSKKGENGIGMQMLSATNSDSGGKEDGNENQKNVFQDVYWFQLTEGTDHRDIYCAKWTTPLLLGNNNSGAVIIKGKGLFELVDFRYGSAFQGLYDTFVAESCNFVQFGRFHRFWLTDAGSLRVIVVTPQVVSTHPEWSELFQPNRSDIINMRILDRRIGYFINAIDKDTTAENMVIKKGKKEKPPEVNLQQQQIKPGAGGVVETMCGLHLHRCWGCKRVLLKPLQCSKCKAVVYCSRTCQRSDWTKHRLKC